MNSNNLILLFLFIIFVIVFIPFLLLFSGISGICSLINGFQPPCHTCAVQCSAGVEADYGGLIYFFDTLIAVYQKWVGLIDNMCI